MQAFPSNTSARYDDSLTHLDGCLIGPIEQIVQKASLIQDQFVLVGVCLSGEVEFNLGKSKQTVGAGNWFIHSSGKTLRGIHFFKDPSIWSICFPLDKFTQLIPQREDEIGPLTRLIYEQDQPSLFTGNTTLNMEQSCAHMSDSDPNQTINLVLGISKSFDILAQIIEHPVLSRPAKCSDLIRESDSNTIKRVTKYLKNNLQEELSLKKICKDCHINEFKLKQGFKKIMGTTVFGYIRKLKMDEAKRMIETEDVSIMEVAAIYGYSNASRFTRTFRAHHGMNPNTLKKISFVN